MEFDDLLRHPDAALLRDARLLPSILVAAGLADGSAGNMQALFIVGVAGGGLVAPILAAASVDQRPHILAIVAVCAAGFAGLLIAPDSVPVVWALILGIGLGAGQAVAGVLYARRGRTPDHVAALSTVAQTGGYLIAATGPILASILHDATGSWTAPVTAFLVCSPSTPSRACARARPEAGKAGRLTSATGLMEARNRPDPMGSPFPPELSRRDRPPTCGTPRSDGHRGVRGIHPTVAVPFRTGASGLGRIVAF